MLFLIVNLRTNKLSMSNEIKRNIFNRPEFLKKTKQFKGEWDIIVIGGGATGLGVALDASSRGFNTLLLEQADFANGTSSRSTKLAHGGVRYLAQGNISLVNEALFERGLMIKNAPHLVKMLPFIIPGYRWWEKPFYGLGLKIYDWMARRYRLNKTKIISSASVHKYMPDLKEKGLKGGVLYYDGQFDDARLAINLAQTCAENGGVLLNYMKVVNLKKDEEGIISGVVVKDLINGEELSLNSKVVINATGVFVDDVLEMNSLGKTPMIKASQGIHLVLDNTFFNGEHALMIPSTPDGRVLFAVPWYGHLLVGTTDTPKIKISLEPVALKSEIAFVLETLGDYLEKKPTVKDVLSVFAGLRPLVMPSKEKGTKKISRDHKLFTSSSRLITITGGKWTTYRKMAEDTIEEAINIGKLEKIPCKTQRLKIHGYKISKKTTGILDIYGSDGPLIRQLARDVPKLSEKLHSAFPHIKAEVVWAARNEMAMTIEDILARRLRILFLNAKVAIEMAPLVADLMATELNFDKDWEETQIIKFREMAQKYLTVPLEEIPVNQPKIKI